MLAMRLTISICGSLIPVCDSLPPTMIGGRTRRRRRFAACAWKYNARGTVGRASSAPAATPTTVLRLANQCASSSTGAERSSRSTPTHETVRDWFGDCRSNATSSKPSKSLPDCRVKVAPEAKAVIAKRVAAGEKQAQVEGVDFSPAFRHDSGTKARKGIAGVRSMFRKQTVGPSACARIPSFDPGSRGARSAGWFCNRPVASAWAYGLFLRTSDGLGAIVPSVAPSLPAGGARMMKGNHGYRYRSPLSFA